MRSIGIMQGRIYPDILDTLQIFPTRRWLDEIARARAIGFDYMELLYDRREVQENPLVDDGRLKEIDHIFRSNGLNFHSICADFFTKIAFPDGWENDGRERLLYLMDVAFHLGIKIIILITNIIICSFTLLSHCDPHHILTKDYSILFHLIFDQALFQIQRYQHEIIDKKQKKIITNTKLSILKY